MSAQSRRQGAARDEGRMLSVPQAASLLEMSESTIRRWIRAGILPAYRIGPKRLRIREDEARAAARPTRLPEPELSEEEAAEMIEAILAARASRERQLDQRGGVPFRPSAEDLYELREERTAQLS